MRSHLTLRILCPALLLSSAVLAQSPAQQLEQYVDGFTGDFRYSVPLLTVPGPNGEAFPLTATYHGGGITMNRDASWLGLGWGMAVGEIHRSVNGIPDDWKAGGAEEMKAYNFSGIPLVTEPKATDYFGPVYFKDICDHTPATGRVRKADVYATRKGVGSTENGFSFQAPDHDDYHVSGPGIGGMMRPFLFEYKSLFNESPGIVHSPCGVNAFTTQPRFRFLHESGAKVRAGYYGNDGPRLWHQLPNAADLSAAYMYFQTPTENPDDFSDDSPEGDALWAANHIEYFTNEEIADGVDGFLEFQVDINRASNDYEHFERHGIGAFRITTPDGLTYHYSLPVYAYDDMVQHFTLRYTGSGFEPITDDDEHPVIIKQKEDRYAATWKLTAVTGPGYVDNSPVGTVGPEDYGYWMKVEYGKWNKTPFEWRSPYYGYHADLSVKDPEWGEVGLEREYLSTGTVTSGKTDIYYPKCIRTSSHVAYFVYSIRLDAHSVEVASLKTPRLGLKRLVLINADNDGLFSSLSNITSTDFTSLGTVAHLNALVSEKHYDDNAQAIEAISLATVEFEQDYSLCEGVYDNINAEVSVASSYTKVAPSHSPTLTVSENSLFQAVQTLQTGAVASSGKLTLKGIAHLGDRHKKYAPSYLFNYSAVNPNYDHRRKDFFGHYKLNHDPIGMGGYITPKNNEHEKLEAWSLKQVITPLGAEIDIEYETDVYDKVCYDDAANGWPQHPNHIFLVKDFNVSNGTVESFTLFDPDGYYYFNIEDNGDEQDRILAKGMAARLTPCSECQWSFPNIAMPQQLHQILSYNSSLARFDVSSYYGVGLPSCPIAPDYYNTCVLEDYYGPYSERKGTAFIGFRMKHSFGGGLRVKSISIREPELDQSYALNYTYADGVVTTEPDRFGKNGFNFNGGLRMSLHGSDRHAHSPTVGYARVDCSIIGDNGQMLGKTVREYHNHVNDMLPSFWTYMYTDDGEIPDGQGGILYDPNRFFGVSVVADDDLTGKLKSRSVFDGDGVRLLKSMYEYEKQAGTDEVFYEYSYRQQTHPSVQDIFNHLAFVKRHRTALLSRVVEIRDDRKVTTDILTRDVLTGAPNLVRTESLSDGVELTVTEPAYASATIMGSKYLNPVNYNQLHTESKKMTYANQLLNDNIRDGVVSDWYNEIDHWVWDGGAEAYGRQSQFSMPILMEKRVFNGEVSPESWKRIYSNTLVDRHGRMLEQRSTDDRFSAVKFGYDERHVVVKMSNSNFQGGTHTSFEDVHQPEAEGDEYFEGYVLKTEATVVMSNPNTNNSSAMRAHSGMHFAAVTEHGPSYSIKVDDDNGHARGLETGRTYTASVWVHKNSATGCGIRLELDGKWDGIGRTMTETAMNSDGGLLLGDWRRLNVTLTVPEDYVATDGPNSSNDLRVSIFTPRLVTGYFDDLRVHPVDATIEAMVYDHRTGRMTFSLDNDNIATKYEYDAAGNVVRVFSEREQGLVKQLETSVRFGREN